MHLLWSILIPVLYVFKVRQRMGVRARSAGVGMVTPRAVDARARARCVPARAAEPYRSCWRLHLSA